MALKQTAWQDSRFDSGACNVYLHGRKGLGVETSEVETPASADRSSVLRLFQMISEYIFAIPEKKTISTMMYTKLNLDITDLQLR